MTADNRSLRGRAVLITGCSTGIGRATAERLARKGYAVYATARRRQTLGDLADVGCKTLTLDVNDESSMREAVETVEADHGAVYGLVNNAGYAVERAIETVPMDEVRKQFETNYFGLVRMCQLVLPQMRKAGAGRIVNISSVGGRLTFPGGAHYHATKHAVEAFSDGLRFELAGFGIKVVIIEPGLIKTAFGDTATEPSRPDDGPYATFNDAVAKRVAGAYEGVMGKLAATGPQTVAAVIDRAISSSRPATRYRVTAGAKLTIATRRLVPDRVWDTMMRAQFPRPGP